jgi:hypothetical protein
MTAATPAALMAMGACSREEPQPKFLPPTIKSPGRILWTNSGSASSMTCRANSAGSEVLR